MRGRLYWWLAALVLIGVAVAGGVLIYRASLERQQAEAAAKPAPAPVPAAEVTIAGPIEAAQFINVAPPVEGAVDALEVEPGEEVFEGQLLARIRNQTLNTERDRAREDANRVQERVHSLDSAVIAARLEASRAAADAARARGESEQAERVALREQALMREGATPRLKHDKAQKEFQATRAEYEALRDKAKAAEER
ncbi:MAG: biotin/lipoyl-binding protein, partial [Bryobacteraceae bacterium]